MDNFILYDEISKTESSVVYKGRRKGSISFVSIHCIEKCMRPEITNLVRLTYEMTHKNAVKFYEWYETSNHLWLVVELCTAGNLEHILDQDECLPESSIRLFGVDVCEGLLYIHSLGLLFCDLTPRKLMCDGNGTLKLSDFGLAKMEGEDLEAIFHETCRTTSSQWQSSSSASSSSSSATNKPPTNATTTSSQNNKVYKKPFGDVRYMAPEVLNGEDNSKASDLWSLGCILYKMYTGHVPFENSSSSSSSSVASERAAQLYALIAASKEMPNPKGNKVSVKPSGEFLGLLRGLLEKEPSKRMEWRALIDHPFWEGRLQHLAPMCADTTSVIDHDDDDAALLNNDDDEEAGDKLNMLVFSQQQQERPRTATAASISFVEQKPPEMNVSFSISSRLPQAATPTTHETTTGTTRHPLDGNDVLSLSARSNTSTLTSGEWKQQQPLSKNVSQQSPVVLLTNRNVDTHSLQLSANDDYKSMLFMPSELAMAPIVDNPKVNIW